MPKTYARLDADGIVRELFIPPGGKMDDGADIDIGHCFHSEVAAQFEEVPTGTLIFSSRVNGKWHAPPAMAEVPAKEQVMVLNDLDGMQLHLAFLPNERIDLLQSSDPYVVDFRDTLLALRNSGGRVNPNTVSFTTWMDALVRMKITTVERVEAIRRGVPA